MKILHTSDWHLGRSLYGKKRYDEFSAFLDWLADIIEEQRIEALLVSGDVFDNTTPSNRAQELYYRFLFRVSTSCCRHIVVIAGNHDSPSFLNAPKELLRVLNVYVTGSILENPAEEVIVLNDEKGKPKVIVCAVPYLRDKDIRTVEPWETMEDKNLKLVEGVKKHYADVCAIAKKKRSELEKSGHPYIPIVAMGHLFTAGGKTVDGDGVRELYVGSLAHVSKDVFPSAIDYFALGHLHVPQQVGNAEHIHYCGSPIPMGFGEAKQQKSILIVEFKDHQLKLKKFPVPCFQPLERIIGAFDDIHERIEQLKQEGSCAWIEVEYTGNEIKRNLQEILDEFMGDSAMEIVRIKNRYITDRVISSIHENETLDDLDIYDVFERCLDTSKVPDEEREELRSSYREIIRSLHEKDVREE